MGLIMFLDRVPCLEVAKTRKTTHLGFTIEPSRFAKACRILIFADVGGDTAADFLPWLEANVPLFPGWEI